MLETVFLGGKLMYAATTTLRDFASGKIKLLWFKVQSIRDWAEFENEIVDDCQLSADKMAPQNLISFFLNL